MFSVALSKYSSRYGSTLTETLDADVTTYSYNAKNQLVTAQKVIGGTTKNLSYTYDIAGIRVTNTVDGVTTEYLVDHNQAYAQVVSESDGTNTIVYTFGDDLISQDRNGVLHTFHYDGLGSTRALSTVDAVISDEYNYEAFGEQVSGSGATENSYLYAGEQRDADLGLDYLRARYLDVGVGRFTQQDTWMGKSMNPITLNKYLYANSDPARYVDPSGNMSLAEFGASFAVQATLVTMATASYQNIMTGGDYDLDIGLSDYQIGFILLASMSSSTSSIVSSIKEKWGEEDIVTLHHGTSANRAYKIEASGFKSPDGPFVFLTSDQSTAAYFARQSGVQRPGSKDQLPQSFGVVTFEIPESIAEAYGIGNSSEYSLGGCLGAMTFGIDEEVPNASERCLGHQFIPAFNNNIVTGVISTSVNKFR